MAMNFSSKISTLLIAASVLLVASCSSGDSDTSGGVSDPIAVSLASLDRAMTAASTGATVVEGAPSNPPSVQHGRFVRRMLLAHARKHDVIAQAHLATLMWHNADMRKYRAIQEEYSVPLNTALHYIQQLYGGAKAAAFRQTGEAEVTKAEFDAAVAQIAALGSAGNTSPQTKEIQATKLAVSTKADTSTCTPSGEINNDIGITLANALHEIHYVGWAFSSVVDMFYPWNTSCEGGTAALQNQINALTQTTVATANQIYVTQSSLLSTSARIYSDAIAYSSDKPYLMQSLLGALTAYGQATTVFRTPDPKLTYSAQLALPFYANFVTQYIGLLQDYIKNAATKASDCLDESSATKWCSAYGANITITDGTLAADMCQYKKELLRVTYDPQPNDPDPKQFTVDECFDAVKNPNKLVPISKADSAKQWVLAAMQAEKIIPAVTESTATSPYYKFPNTDMLTWNARNAWTRVTTLNSVDQAMHWPYMNIIAYPPKPCASDATKNCNPDIPEVILFREVYSDIVGATFNECSDYGYHSCDSWTYSYTNKSLKDAQEWADQVVANRDYPYHGPITNIDLTGAAGHCSTGCSLFGGRVWDIKVTYAPFPNPINGGAAASYTSPGVPNTTAGKDKLAGGSNDRTIPTGGFNLPVGLPQPCDYDSKGARWTKGACTLDAGGLGAIYAFSANVILDEDNYPRSGIPCADFWYLGNTHTGCRPTYPGTDTYVDAKKYSAPDLSGNGTSTTIFSLAGHIISSITPYGTTLADASCCYVGNAANSLSSFIVGYRPYNAWGFGPTN